MLARLLQPWNEKLPILVTLFGIVMLLRLLQDENAELPMLVIPSDIVMVIIWLRYKFHGAVFLS